MLKRHFTSAGASIEHGDARPLFPVDALDATVYQGRDTELILDETDEGDVIVVAPTGLASSYFLTQHVLSAIPVDELSHAVRSQLADALEAPIEAFALIQVGKWITDSPDHSLAEYAVD